MYLFFEYHLFYQILVLIIFNDPDTYVLLSI